MEMLWHAPATTSPTLQSLWLAFLFLWMCVCICSVASAWLAKCLASYPGSSTEKQPKSLPVFWWRNLGTRLLSAIFEQIFCCFQANTCRNNILSMVNYPLCVQSIWYERSITFIDLIFRISAQGFGTACHLLYLKLHWKCSLLLEWPFPWLGSLLPLSPCFCSSEFQCRVIQNCRSYQ